MTPSVNAFDSICRLRMMSTSNAKSISVTLDVAAVRPQPLYIVELAGLIGEYMDYHRAVIERDPLPVGVALGRIEPELFVSTSST